MAGLVLCAVAAQAAGMPGPDAERKAHEKTVRVFSQVRPAGGLPEVEAGGGGEAFERVFREAERRVRAARVEKAHEARRGVEAWVLVSSSVPRASLVRLLRDARLAGVPVVVRGFPEEDGRPSLAAMRRWVRSLGEDAGVLVDPRVFRRFGVERVPAFVVDGEVVYGDVSLGYALRWLVEHRPRARAGAQVLLRRMGGG